MWSPASSASISQRIKPMEGVRNGLERLLAAMERELELLDALIAAAQESRPFWLLPMWTLSPSC